MSKKMSIIERRSRKSSTENRYDFIIFGATGLAGRHVVAEAITALKDYKWAVAGRNREKLSDMLYEVGFENERNTDEVQKIEATMNDYKSIQDMVQSCRVLLNCSGPGVACNERLIIACLASGTHYIDICFEPGFVTTMHKRYNEPAERNGVYILTACGFECFANEIFINQIDDTFSGLVRQVDSYVQYWSPEETKPLFTANFAESLLYSLTNGVQFRKLKENLSLNRLFNYNCSQCDQALMHIAHDVGETINVSTPLIEQKIFDHTQKMLEELEGKRPIKFNKYFAFPTLIKAALFLIWSIAVTILCQCDKLRTLLALNPTIWSLGYACSSNTSVYTEHLSELNYSIHYYVICSEGNGAHPVRSRHVVANLKGTNPFYGFSSAALLVSGINLLKNFGQLPSRGGVFTPGVAFRNIDVLSDLSSFDHLFSFQIMEVEEGKNKIWCLI